MNIYFMPAIAVEKVAESAQFGVISEAEKSMSDQFPSLYPSLTPLAQRFIGAAVKRYSNEPSIAGCEVELYFSGWNPKEEIGERHIGLTGQEETRVDVIGVKPWPYVTINNLAATPFEGNWEELHRLAKRLHSLPLTAPQSEDTERFLQLFPSSENPIEQSPAMQPQNLAA